MYTKIAHINKSGEIQTIQEHLQGTAERAKEFASEFGCGEVGYLCGLMHDIGKYSEEFQKRIQNPKHSKKVDHSTAGAKELCSISSDYIPIAMAVAGHHSGLLDGGQARLAQSGTFFGRLKNELPKYQEWKREIEPTKASVPAFCMTGRHAVYTMSFFIRMIYSCLVDADYLDTEAFMTQNPPERGRGDSMAALLEKLQCYITPWLESVEFSHEKQRLLCENRTRILMECLEKGGGVQKGLYTLTWIYVNTLDKKSRKIMLLF